MDPSLSVDNFYNLNIGIEVCHFSRITMSIDFFSLRNRLKYKPVENISIFGD